MKNRVGEIKREERQAGRRHLEPRVEGPGDEDVAL